MDNIRFIVRLSLPWPGLEVTLGNFTVEAGRFGFGLAQPCAILPSTVMALTKQQLWDRFQQYYSEYPGLGLALDISRMNFPDDFFARMEPAMQEAYAEMDDLEKGAIANPDEKRMVGHYWLRNPALAPTGVIKKEIEDTVAAIKVFAQKVHQGKVSGRDGTFSNLLLIGIGGSALGPQFVSKALGSVNDPLKAWYFDNTDPDGMDSVLSYIKPYLGRTLTIVVSKSGGTKETRNGMLEAKAAYEVAGLKFEQHSVAVTSKGSELDKIAESWLARFPMWDWVGGRTSELSGVGLLPAALQGSDIDQLLAGAKACDDATRAHRTSQNPSRIHQPCLR
jgi:glucose-6-phosphate isomerase